MCTFRPWLALGLSLAFATAFSAPSHLITHNETDVESDAFVGGTISSKHPTPAHWVGRVPWPAVRILCLSQTIARKDHLCSALIKMASNSPQPLELGMLSMNVETGEITPKTLQAHGYLLTVNGPGETTITTVN